MDFTRTHQTAILLAGTVALPSPFPASGSLSIVLTPEEGEPEVYIKIVQVLSHKRLITRFLRLADLRAIRAPKPGAPPGGPETWPVVGLGECRREIETIEKDLREKVKKSKSHVEGDWLPAAIVYAAETAPVLHRDEVGVTAAVSAEDVGYSPLPATICHHKEEWKEGLVERGFCAHK
jgi:hypothetical protein